MHLEFQTTEINGENMREWGDIISQRHSLIYGSWRKDRNVERIMER
jgi:hypothetical protein